MCVRPRELRQGSQLQSDGRSGLASGTVPLAAGWKDIWLSSKESEQSSTRGHRDLN